MYRYFSPECEFLNDSIQSSQKTVNGVVRVHLYKGSVRVLSRTSESKLYGKSRIYTFDHVIKLILLVADMQQSSMDEVEGFEPTETTGFIGVTAIRLKQWASDKKQ